MTPNEFTDLLARFAKRPLPAVNGRHLYLWHGEADSLRSLLPLGLSVWLDLFALAGKLPRTPFAADEARRVLHSAIVTWLREHSPPTGSQQVVVVTGNSLLMRYRVLLDTFFQVSDESRLFVFAISPQETVFQPRQPLPSYILLYPSATFDYLKSKLGERFVIGEAPQ